MSKPAHFFIVEPYADGPNRFHQSTVLSSHPTAKEAFAELARLTERLHRFGIHSEQFEWVVVDAERRLVQGH